MHVFAQIIALLIVSGKCYRHSVMKDNLPFTINTATANGWGQTGMYNRPAKISQMMKVEFVAGELIKKADVTNTKLFFL